MSKVPEPVKTVVRLTLMMIMLAGVMVMSHQNPAPFVYGGF
jgi:hypothetical protein